jgi:prepilin-type N-terminal cleavage/methylation domain-containing protein
MSRSSSKPASAGFTLMEVLVVLAALGMILWMAGQLLFPMRQAAERQRLQVEARQTARSGADYAAFLLRGATDMNDTADPLDPAIILTYLWKGSNPGAGFSFPACPGDGGCVQLSYNNVDQGATDFASDGTDIITLTSAQVAYPGKLMAAAPFPNPLSSASVEYWAFNLGCAAGSPTEDTDNFNAFLAVTQDPSITPPAQPKSLPFIVTDPGSGAWLIYQITDYRSGSNGSTCTSPDPNCVVGGASVPCVQVSADPDNANALNPPGGPSTLGNLPNLIVGSRFMTLRVCNGWLEQKEGLFDPQTDNNCPALPAGTVEFPQQPPHDPSTGWAALLPNVEDFQIAYILRNGNTWNGPGATLSAAQGCDNGVPSSNNAPGAVGQNDARSVLGLRITVTARSSTPVQLGAKVAFRQPPAEDHDPTTAPEDFYYRFQVSAVALLRNRAVRM